MSCGDVVRRHGLLYVVTIVLFFGATKGLSGGLLRGIALPYFQDHHGVGLREYHRLYSIALLLPWSLKPLFGVVTDLFPIFGRRKRYYVLASMAALVWASLTLPSATKAGAAAAMTVASFSVVCADLLFEASYAEEVRESANGGLLRVAWGSVSIGAAVAAVNVGVMGDRQEYSTAFYIAAVPPAVVAVAVAAGWLRETPVRFSAKTVWRHRREAGVAVAIALAALAMAYALEAGGIFGRIAAVVIVPLVVFGLAFRVQPPVVANCNLFLFLAEAMSANFVGATDFFYTQTCHGTPNFDYTFYVTYTMLLSSVFSLIGIWAHARFENTPLKQTFAVLTVVRVVCATVEVIQVTRINVGTVSDEALYLLGEGVVQPVVSMLFLMPMVALTARLATPGMEGLTYATLAGTQNLGALVAAVVGAVITDTYDIKGCNFERFPSALVLGHMTLPMAVLPLGYLLLPNYDKS